MVEIEVVVEAGVGGRADVEFGVGEKTEDSRRKDVRGRVAEFFEGRHHGSFRFLILDFRFQDLRPVARYFFTGSSL
jgi:hypothetical protein